MIFYENMLKKRRYDYIIEKKLVKGDSQKDVKPQSKNKPSKPTIQNIYTIIFTKK